MSIRSGFFNSVGNDRLYGASGFSEYFSSFIGNGVFPNPSTNLQVVANNNMTVTIKAGKAWINGYILINDDDYILNIDVADGVLKRIDRLVLKLDTTLNRSIDVYIKKGTFASTPTAPTLQRDADAYEIALADITVNNGVIQITQANVTDLRQNGTYCGIVSGTVDQIDASGLFAQYEQAFNDWFITLEDVLDENTAANLLALINSNSSDISEIEDGLEDMTNRLTNLISEGTSTITTTGWVANTGDYPLKLDLAVTGILSTDKLIVEIDNDYQDIAQDAEVARKAVEYAGGLTFYCKTAPTVAIPFTYTRLR